MPETPAIGALISRLRTALGDATAPLPFADASSRPGIRRDLLLYRALRPLSRLKREPLRVIRDAEGRSLVYRLNRGDLWTLREVFLEEAYRLPEGVPTRVVVDLGANVGLTSRWMAGQFAPELMIVVEPVPENMALARRNLAHLGDRVVFLESAVVPEAGPVHFETSARHSKGRVSGSGGTVVDGVTMGEILRLVPDGRIDVLKIDIEGGEGPLLLAEDLSWLDSVALIIAEFHPDVVDYPRLVAILQAHGFRYIPAESMWSGQMDILLRDDEYVG